MLPPFAAKCWQRLVGKAGGFGCFPSPFRDAKDFGSSPRLLSLFRSALGAWEDWKMEDGSDEVPEMDRI